MNSLSNLAFALGSWANKLPALWRKRIYKTVKMLSGLATLALLVLPYVPTVGVHLPANVNYDAILTGLLAFLGHLADRNTLPDPTLDMTQAPEPGNPEPPADPPAEPPAPAAS